MSSFSKNIIPRRAHRERSQPRQRIERHGLLEKKKDYKLRSKDANRKKYRLKLLKEKAAFRNPDEFYHAMQNAMPTVEGRVRGFRDPNLAKSHDHAKGPVRRLVETQDRAYVGMKRRRERCIIETAKNSLHFLDAAKANTQRSHMIFLDQDDNETLSTCSVQNLREKSQSILSVSGAVAPGVDADGALVNRTGRKSARRQAGKKSRKAYDQLEKRIARAAGLDSAVEDLTLQAHLLGKGARRMVHRGDPKNGLLPVFKWRKQRKR